MAEPTGKGSPAMEARRTKMRDGAIQELPPPPGDTRGRVGGRESPHAAACRRVEAAKRDNDASDPLPSLSAVVGPATCTVCKRRKVPIGQALGDAYCDDTCYAYRWSPTPPTMATFEPYPETKQEGAETP